MEYCRKVKMEFCRKVSSLLLFVLQETQCIVKTKVINLIRTQTLGSKVMINILLILVYGYLLATSGEWSGDHVDIACINVLTCLSTLRFLLTEYVKQFFYFFCRLRSVYGWVRILSYFGFLLIFSYTFVAVFLDNSALKGMQTAKELFLSRYENNTMHIEEDRQYFEREMPHPLSGGEQSPPTIYQLVRYPMEDAQMNCTAYFKGFRGGKPFVDQVEWRRNGVPLKGMTDRYSVVTQFRELPHDHPWVDEDMKAHRLSAYELKSTLSIYLLDEADFGSYTCHTLDKVKVPADEWESKTGKKPDQKYFKFKKRDTKFNSKQKSAQKERRCCVCTCPLERKYDFRDVHTQVQEFRLMKMGERHDQIEAPAASILFFSTNYLHLSSCEDVHSDYTVNDHSFEGLCTDETRFDVRGCSSLQRLLAYFMFDADHVWWWFDFLPLSATHRRDVRGAHLTSGHCLCENSFGQHNMKYTRRYYNRTSGIFQMFEVVHPHTLLVRPSQQTSSNFFANIWKHGSMKLLPLADYLPEYAYNLSLLRDLAVASGIILNLTDAVFISLGLTALILAFILTLCLFRVVGCVSRRCLLDGSLGYLATATLTFRNLARTPAVNGENAERQRFDVFLSHSDSQADEQVVRESICPWLEDQLGLKVFFRQRDLLADTLELGGLGQAMENSQRFIILFSKDFLQDRLLELEIHMMIHTLSSRLSESLVLVIKVDDSQIPACWTDFTVHDWTSGNLSLEDHHLRLVRWLASDKQQVKGLRCAFDALITFSLFLLLFAFHLISSQFWAP